MRLAPAALLTILLTTPEVQALDAVHEPAPVAETLKRLECNSTAAEAERILRNFIVKKSQVSPESTNPKGAGQHFLKQAENIVSLVYSTCISASEGKPMVCDGLACSPREGSSMPYEAWMPYAVPTYTTVDQNFFYDGECSALGLSMDALTQVTRKLEYPSPLGGQVSQLRAAVVKETVEACLDLRTGKNTFCGPFSVGAGEGLECWPVRTTGKK